MAAITPFGSSGPNAEYAARDVNVFHAGGEGNLLPNGLALDTFPGSRPYRRRGNDGVVPGRPDRRRGNRRRGAGPVGKTERDRQWTVRCRKLNWPSDTCRYSGWRPRAFVETRFSRFFRMGGVLPAADGYVELLTLEPRQWEGLSGTAWKSRLGHSRQVPGSCDAWAGHQRKPAPVDLSAYAGVAVPRRPGPRRSHRALPDPGRGVWKPAAARKRLLRSNRPPRGRAITTTLACPCGWKKPLPS